MVTEAGGGCGDRDAGDGSGTACAGGTGGAFGACGVNSMGVVVTQLMESAQLGRHHSWCGRRHYGWWWQ